MFDLSTCSNCTFIFSRGILVAGNYWIRRLTLDVYLMVQGLKPLRPRGRLSSDVNRLTMNYFRQRTVHRGDFPDMSKAL